MGGLPPVPRPDYDLVNNPRRPSITTLALKHGCPACGVPAGVMCVRLSGFTKLLKLKPRSAHVCCEARHAKRVLAGD